MNILFPNPLSQLSKSASQKMFRHFFCTRSPKSLDRSDPSNNLYKRISPLGDPKISVVPVLDQWAAEGRPVHKEYLESIIKELKAYKRYKHALEVSRWMTEKRYMPLRELDVSIQINLIHRVHGLKEAENCFNNVSSKLKGFNAHIALLNCYVHEKSAEKAEALMQKMREMGYANSPLPYNLMMNLHYGLGNCKKLDDLMNEMEGRGIKFDPFTLTIRLSAYAAASDAEGVDKIAKMMEIDPLIVPDFSAYAVVAQGYLKVGQLDKALPILNKMEELAVTTRKGKFPYDFLLKLYAGMQRRDDVLRIWEMYKQKQKINNKGYMTMMSSLLSFGDIGGIEDIFKEWESRGLSYDFRVPNVLIHAYCRNGELEKAEALIDKGLSEGGEPFSTTWFYMALGYIKDNQISKAVEALKKAILKCPPDHKPNTETLNTCLEHMERGDVEKSEEFIKLIKKESLYSLAVQDSSMDFIKSGESQS
ncbi:pentatricopeptide repeat-containing protein At2g20710, mitochondrial-like [Coffea arabica]|uniref:Pentatricopeptide repeat-containing protein At2g20710, mitochondrial-like n=1 Tax=Coffea arabica TaxID=13443 RepID=A0A6P6WCM2_COFAR|nr:pentatricopeptide repeat-containing protein At2g20710, mitochondrial-like [Coffea arabica]